MQLSKPQITIGLLLVARLASALKDVTTTCGGSCSHASDGDCDDGGPGADYNSCELGDDCADCGVRCPCDIVGVNISGVAGHYSQLDLRSADGRWIYRNLKTGLYLFFWADYNQWRIGINYSTPNAQASGGDSSSFCPSGESSWWALNSGSWIAAGGSSDEAVVTCGRPSAPVHTCWIDTLSGYVYLPTCVLVYMIVELLISIRQSIRSEIRMLMRQTRKHKWDESIMLKREPLGKQLRRESPLLVMFVLFALPIFVTLRWCSVSELGELGRMTLIASAVFPLAVPLVKLVKMLCAGTRSRQRRRLQARVSKLEGDLPALFGDETIKLLSVKWLLHEGDKPLILSRRQDLPDEAFVPRADAKDLLARGDVVALSYCWITPEHPDPEGWHIERVRAFLHQNPKINAMGLFMDFVSLPQKDSDGLRSEDDKQKFEKGLSAMSKVYASPRITVLQHKKLPLLADGTDPRRYDRSGWCVFEESAASLSKGGFLYDISQGRVELQAYTEVSDLKAVQSRLRDSASVHFTSGSADRDKVAQQFKTLANTVATLDANLYKTAASANALVVGRSTRACARRAGWRIMLCFASSFSILMGATVGTAATELVTATASDKVLIAILGLLIPCAYLLLTVYLLLKSPILSRHIAFIITQEKGASSSLPKYKYRFRSKPIPCIWLFWGPILQPNEEQVAPSDSAVEPSAATTS